jgi:predicted  nucleic acid-binding Zn-ribbon protein
MNRWAGLVAALILAGFGISVAAQQAAPLQTELLTEVRLLRQSIELLAGTNARVQIVFGRLQLQEQRTATAARRLDELRNAVAAISIRAAEMGDRIKELEETANDSRLKPEQFEAMRAELTMARRELSRIDAERARVMAEETEAAGALNQEQGRSSDLNRQLDELERALVPRQ